MGASEALEIQIADEAEIRIDSTTTKAIRKDLLEDTEDMVGDGGVEEEEEDNDGGCDSAGCLGSVTAIKGIPEEETNHSKEEGKEQVGQEVYKPSSDWDI